MTSKIKQDKIDKRMAELRRLPDNRICCDCRAKNPTSVVLDLNTFICTNCTTFHRNLNRKCVTISMYNFGEKDVARLEAGGNAVANAYWLASYTDKDFPIPPFDAESSYRDSRMADFIRLKYDNKRWIARDGVPSRTNTSNTTAAAAPGALAAPPGARPGASRNHSPSPSPRTTPAAATAPAPRAVAPAPAPAPAAVATATFDVFASMGSPNVEEDWAAFDANGAPAHKQQQPHQPQSQQQQQQQQQPAGSVLSGLTFDNNSASAPRGPTLDQVMALNNQLHTAPQYGMNPMMGGMQMQMPMQMMQVQGPNGPMMVQVPMNAMQPGMLMHGGMPMGGGGAPMSGMMMNPAMGAGGMGAMAAMPMTAMANMSMMNTMNNSNNNVMPQQQQQQRPPQQPQQQQAPVDPFSFMVTPAAAAPAPAPAAAQPPRPSADAFNASFDDDPFSDAAMAKFDATPSSAAAATHSHSTAAVSAMAVPAAAPASKNATVRSPARSPALGPANAPANGPSSDDVFGDLLSANNSNATGSSARAVTPNRGGSGGQASVHTADVFGFGSPAAAPVSAPAPAPAMPAYNAPMMATAPPMTGVGAAGGAGNNMQAAQMQMMLQQQQMMLQAMLASQQQQGGGTNPALVAQMAQMQAQMQALMLSNGSHPAAAGHPNAGGFGGFPQQQQQQHGQPQQQQQSKAEEPDAFAGLGF